MAKEVFDFYDRTYLKSYNLDKSMRYQLSILESLDVFTRNHSENVANITCRLCKYLHCKKGFTEYCIVCAYLHDIGKQFIPPSILQKQSQLTDEESEITKTHTTLGYQIRMNDLKLRPCAAGTIYHHESLNGTGYPNALVKKDIPYEGQIIRVADEFDAIVSKRQYKSHVGIIDTLNILIGECKPIEDPEHYRVPVKDTRYGKLNPNIVKVLIKVVIDDTEYEISCIMDYLKTLKQEIKRLEIVEKYDKKRALAKTKDKQDYYLSGMKYLLTGRETLDNYAEILDSYRNTIVSETEHINKLFDEIKTMKKLKV